VCTHDSQHPISQQPVSPSHCSEPVELCRASGMFDTSIVMTGPRIPGHIVPFQDMLVRSVWGFVGACVCVCVCVSVHPFNF
jgi:hypothetical protein